LQWAAENAKHDEIRSIAALRLSTVLLDDGDPEAALKVLETKPHSSFESLHASLRGDILATQKKYPEARTAYKAALEKAEPGAFRDTLRLKLEALGEG